MDEGLWKTKKVAKRIDTTENAVTVMRCRGLGPRFIRINKRCIRYRPQDVEKWLNDRIVETSDSVNENDQITETIDPLGSSP